MLDILSPYYEFHKGLDSFNFPVYNGQASGARLKNLAEELRYSFETDIIDNLRPVRTMV